MYKPTAVDIQWAQDLIDHMAENGIWVWPDTNLEYKLVHSVQTMYLVNHELLFEDENLQEAHARTIAVFEQVGWKVKYLP